MFTLLSLPLQFNKSTPELLYLISSSWLNVPFSSRGVLANSLLSDNWLHLVLEREWSGRSFSNGGVRSLRIKQASHNHHHSAHRLLVFSSLISLPQLLILSIFPLHLSAKLHQVSRCFQRLTTSNEKIASFTISTLRPSSLLHDLVGIVRFTLSGLSSRFTLHPAFSALSVLPLWLSHHPAPARGSGTSSTSMLDVGTQECIYSLSSPGSRRHGDWRPVISSLCSFVRCHFENAGKIR